MDLVDRIDHLSSALSRLRRQSIDITLHRRLRSIGSTAKATGNTSQRSTERRPNCESSGQCSEINCFPNPDGDALCPTGSLSNRKPLRKTASPLLTHLPSTAASK